MVCLAASLMFAARIATTGDRAPVYAIALSTFFVWSMQARNFASTTIVRFTPARLKPMMESKLALFMQGLGGLRDPSVLIKVLALSVMVYLVDMCAYWTVGEAFGFDIEVLSFLLVVAVGNLAVALPISFGGIGPYEFFVQQALIGLGITSALALAYAVFVHALTLLFVMVTGLILVGSGLKGVKRLLNRDSEPALATRIERTAP